VNLLLDTNALLWWRAGNRQLGPRARALIARHSGIDRVRLTILPSSLRRLIFFPRALAACDLYRVQL
jgi:hypothetical protein